jgi:ATP-dependent DNA helicase RecG
MLKTELFEIIANGENSGVEFKRDDVRPEQLAKEVVAFANFQGGRILLGVEDDGTTSGMNRPDGEAERWIMDTVFGRYVHPQILPFYEEVLLDDGRRVAVVTIEAGVSKPYVLRYNGREDIYVRVGSTSRLASREQQARLFAAGSMLHAETMAVSGTSLADLHLERLTDYLTGCIKDPSPPPDQAGWHERLSGLGFLAPAPDGRYLCSIAGLLSFGRNPRRALPQAGVRWMAFDSEEKEYEARDDINLDGPLAPLMQRTDEGITQVEPGLVERVMERMRPFVSLEESDVAADLRRGRRYLYPLEAIREALLNAIVHRDWTRSVEVEVVAYRDRLEITSPGALQNSMTVAKMLAGQRSPRNPILIDVCRDYGYVDARGMGVRRKIVPLVRAAAGQDARFEAAEDFVRVILPKGAQEN